LSNFPPKRLLRDRKEGRMRPIACSSGKKMYSIPAALAEIERAKDVPGWDVVRVYWCRECESAHLTSKEA
jgi:hypothetical protein